jgi:hypothetical protein
MLKCQLLSNWFGNANAWSYWCDNMPIIGVVGVAMPIIVIGVDGVKMPIIGVIGVAMLNMFELLVWQCQLFESLV